LGNLGKGAGPGLGLGIMIKERKTGGEAVGEDEHPETLRGTAPVAQAGVFPALMATTQNKGIHFTSRPRRHRNIHN
jgi:hypothetical protein